MQSAEQAIRGRLIGGEGDVVDGDDSHEGFHVGVVGLGLKGIPKEDDLLNVPIGDLSPDLKVPSQRAGEVLLDLQPGGFLNHLGGVPGSAEGIMGELFSVLHGPSDHFGFFVVVGDQGHHGFIVFHGDMITGMGEGTKKKADSFTLSAKSRSF